MIILMAEQNNYKCLGKLEAGTVKQMEKEKDSLFNGISTLFMLFNAKAILLEEQWWCYLTHSWEEKEKLETTINGHENFIKTFSAGEI